MRLLFDEQFSEELCTHLQDIFPDSQHVRLLDAGGGSDDHVWQLAINRNCVLVTKDEDFHRLSVLRGSPPKVIWIRIGNCTTADVARLILGRLHDIERFVAQEEANVLELGR